MRELNGRLHELLGITAMPLYGPGFNIFAIRFSRKLKEAIPLTNENSTEFALSRPWDVYEQNIWMVLLCSYFKKLSIRSLKFMGFIIQMVERHEDLLITLSAAQGL